MKNKELFEQRVKNIVDATNFKEPKKVPVGFDYLSWPYVIGGKTLEELIDSPEENLKEYSKVFDEVEFDFSFNFGNYIPIDAYRILGSTGYALCNDKCTVQHNQANSIFMSDDEYDILINDTEFFTQEYFLKKRAKVLSLPKEEALPKLKEAAKRFINNNWFTNEMTRIGIEEYSKVPLVNMGPPLKAPLSEDYGIFSPTFYANIDNLFDTYRGMMGVFEDLAENVETLDRAIEAIDKCQSLKFPALLPQFDPHPLPFGGVVFHIAGFLSRERFEKYWFNDFRNFFMPYAEQGKKIYMKGQASFLHVLDYFNEFPKGSIIIVLDNDDPFEAYKIIGGKQVLAAGLRTSMLHTNDIETCKDYIKKCFDTFAPGGGFLFSTDKGLMSPSDAPLEKVKELWHFANEYSYGK